MQNFTRKGLLLLAALIGSLSTALWLTIPVSPPPTLASSIDEIASKPVIPPGLAQPKRSNANIDVSDFDNLGDPHDTMKEKLMIEHGLIRPDNGPSAQNIDLDDPHDAMKEKLMIEHGLISPSNGPSIQKYDHGSVDECILGRAMCVDVVALP